MYSRKDGVKDILPRPKKRTIATPTQGRRGGNGQDKKKKKSWVLTSRSNTRKREQALAFRCQQLKN